MDESDVALAPGAGLNIDAFTLIFGEVEGDAPFSIGPDGVLSLPRLDIVRCIVGVGGPEKDGAMGIDGDWGRPSGVRARNEGTLAGAKGRSEWLEFRDGEALARDGVRCGAYGLPSISSVEGQCRYIRQKQPRRV